MVDVLARALSDRNHHLAEAAKLQEFVDIYRRYDAEVPPSQPDAAPEPVTNDERVAGWRSLWQWEPVKESTTPESSVSAASEPETAPESTPPKDEAEDACPDDPDGAHHTGCGCDQVSNDDPPQPDLPAETEQAGASNSVAPADHPPETDKPAEASASAAPLTLKDRIIALRAAHPDWTLDQATEHLGANRSSLAACASKLGFKWPRPEPVKKEPRFLLRNHFGEYLHRNQSTVTRLPKFYGAWTQAECDAIKAKGGKFAELTERPAP